MISHRHRCIYVKAPKCASTSVLEWFLLHGAGRHTDRPSWYPGPLEYRIVPTATAIALYPDYFTFTFLRDPHRRFLSIFRHAERLARTGAPRQPRTYGSPHDFAELCAELLADTRGLWGAEALAFRAGRAERRYGPLGIPLRLLYFLACHARPQVDFLPGGDPVRLFGVALPGSAPLGFIGAVETLDADFTRLQERLGLPPVPPARRNVSPPAPEALHLEAATRRLVEEIYAEDFAFAGSSQGAAPGLVVPRPVRTPRRAHPSIRLRRARLALAAAETALEARIVRATRLRRVLAPFARLRRRLA